MTDKYYKLPLVTEFDYQRLTLLLENEELRLLREYEKTQNQEIRAVLLSHQLFTSWFKGKSQQVEV